MRRNRRYSSCLVLFPILFLLTSCSGVNNAPSNGGGTANNPPLPNSWAWVGGSNAPGINGGHGGIYGSQGVAAAANIPGSRQGATTWIDSSGNLWLFGGFGYSAEGPSAGEAGFGYLNDLWEFNPATKMWTWIAGAKNTGGLHGSPGVYGTIDVAATSNMPGGRSFSSGWTDSHGVFWMFGGDGFDSTGSMLDGLLSDLWSFDPSTRQWTWRGGPNTARTSMATGHPGVYGTIGVASATNIPGGRAQAVSWTGADGNLWLFGGDGFGADGLGGLLNDLWSYNPSTKLWTWMSGADVANQSGVYGSSGQSSSSNVPGGRYSGSGWIDGSGRLWLFGGTGFGAASSAKGLMNDLWMFDPSTKNWTWLGGSQISGATGVYGTLGVGATTNSPAASVAATSWTDSQHNFWLFGGNSTNALWKFTPANGQWTWVSGTNVANATSTYGTLGTPSTGNTPGYRYASASWVDGSNQLWLFGGDGVNSSGSSESLNDFWRYQP